MDENWHSIPIPSSGTQLETSIADAVVPSGLHVLSNFMTDEDVTQLMSIVHENSVLWKHKGFQEKRRFQRHKIFPSSQFDWIVEKLMNAMEELPSSCHFEKPDEIIIEEMKPTSFIPVRCNRFELATKSTSDECICLQNDAHPNCPCYVAELTLGKCVQSIDRPKVRQSECWDLSSPQHGYSFVMPTNTLFVKTGDCLWNWRSRNFIPIRQDEGDVDNRTMGTPTYTIKFKKTMGVDTKPDTNNEEKKEESELSNLEVESNEAGNDHLSNLLTIIVTTSPIKSNPSTELLEKTFATFRHGGYDFTLCEKIIVCDGCRILEEENKEANEPLNKPNKVSKKYQTTKQALRNGIATNTQADNYQLFKIALKKICEEADGNKSSPFYNTRVVELEERMGYGFALRHTLYHEVVTPYVCVIQHDRTFMRSTPMKAVVEAMMNKRVNGDIKYVGMSMRSNLNYRDIFTSKYGKDSLQELLNMVILPPELVLDAEVYGPNDSLMEKIDCDDALKSNLQSLSRSYLHGSIQYRSHKQQLETSRKELKETEWQLSLTPTLFWYDNTHVCETSHYRDFIFNPKYKMVARGGFVEDKLSPVITKSVERLGLREGHDKFNCYLLDDHSGFFFTGHLDGGSFMTADEKQAVRKNKK